jgi:hypothetical protein
MKIIIRVVMEISTKLHGATSQKIAIDTSYLFVHLYRTHRKAVNSLIKSARCFRRWEFRLWSSGCDTV